MVGGSPESRTKGEWSRSISQIRGGNCSKANKYRNKVDQIDEIAERFKYVQIENRDGLEMCKEYDGEGKVFYLDPLYHPEVRENSAEAYGKNEFGYEKHRGLAEVVNQIDAYVAISGYKCEAYQELFGTWNVYTDAEKANQNGPSGEESDTSTTQEALFTNYKAEHKRGF